MITVWNAVLAIQKALHKDLAHQHSLNFTNLTFFPYYYQGRGMQLRRQFCGALFFSFHLCMDSGAQTRVFRFAPQTLYPPIHLTDPNITHLHELGMRGLLRLLLFAFTPKAVRKGLAALGRDQSSPLRLQSEDDAKRGWVTTLQPSLSRRGFTAAAGKRYICSAVSMATSTRPLDCLRKGAASGEPIA